MYSQYFHERRPEKVRVKMTFRATSTGLDEALQDKENIPLNEANSDRNSNEKNYLVDKSTANLEDMIPSSVDKSKFPSATGIKDSQRQLTESKENIGQSSNTDPIDMSVSVLKHDESEVKPLNVLAVNKILRGASKIPKRCAQNHSKDTTTDTIKASAKTDASTKESSHSQHETFGLTSNEIVVESRPIKERSSIPSTKRRQQSLGHSTQYIDDSIKSIDSRVTGRSATEIVGSTICAKKNPLRVASSLNIDKRANSLNNSLKATLSSSTNDTSNHLKTNDMIRISSEASAYTIYEDRENIPPKIHPEVDSNDDDMNKRQNQKINQIKNVLLAQKTIPMAQRRLSQRFITLLERGQVPGVQEAYPRDYPYSQPIEESSTVAISKPNISHEVFDSNPIKSRDSLKPSIQQSFCTPKKPLQSPNSPDSAIWASSSRFNRLINYDLDELESICPDDEPKDSPRDLEYQLHHDDNDSRRCESNNYRSHVCFAMIMLMIACIPVAIYGLRRAMVFDASSDLFSQPIRINRNGNDLYLQYQTSVNKAIHEIVSTYQYLQDRAISSAANGVREFQSIVPEVMDSTVANGLASAKAYWDENYNYMKSNSHIMYRAMIKYDISMSLRALSSYCWEYAIRAREYALGTDWRSNFHKISRIYELDVLPMIHKWYNHNIIRVLELINEISPWTERFQSIAIERAISLQNTAKEVIFDLHGSTDNLLSISISRTSRELNEFYDNIVSILPTLQDKLDLIQNTHKQRVQVVKENRENSNDDIFHDHAVDSPDSIYISTLSSLWNHVLGQFYEIGQLTGSFGSINYKTNHQKSTRQYLRQSSMIFPDYSDSTAYLRDAIGQTIDAMTIRCNHGLRQLLRVMRSIIDSMELYRKQIGIYELISGAIDEEDGLSPMESHYVDDGRFVTSSELLESIHNQFYVNRISVPIIDDHISGSIENNTSDSSNAVEYSPTIDIDEEYIYPSHPQQIENGFKSTDSAVEIGIFDIESMDLYFSSEMLASHEDDALKEEETSSNSLPVPISDNSSGTTTPSSELMKSDEPSPSLEREIAVDASMNEDGETQSDLLQDMPEMSQNTFDASVMGSESQIGENIDHSTAAGNGHEDQDTIIAMPGMDADIEGDESTNSLPYDHNIATPAIAEVSDDSQGCELDVPIHESVPQELVSSRPADSSGMNDLRENQDDNNDVDVMDDASIGETSSIETNTAVDSTNLSTEKEEMVEEISVADNEAEQVMVKEHTDELESIDNHDSENEKYNFREYIEILQQVEMINEDVHASNNVMSEPSPIRDIPIESETSAVLMNIIPQNTPQSEENPILVSPLDHPAMPDSFESPTDVSIEPHAIETSLSSTTIDDMSQSKEADEVNPDTYISNAIHPVGSQDHVESDVAPDTANEINFIPSDVESRDFHPVPMNTEAIDETMSAASEGDSHEESIAVAVEINSEAIEAESATAADQMSSHDAEGLNELESISFLTNIDAIEPDQVQVISKEAAIDSTAAIDEPLPIQYNQQTISNRGEEIRTQDIDMHMALLDTTCRSETSSPTSEADDMHVHVHQSIDSTADLSSSVKIMVMDEKPSDHSGRKPIDIQMPQTIFEITQSNIDDPVDYLKAITDSLAPFIGILDQLVAPYETYIINLVTSPIELLNNPETNEFVVIAGTVTVMGVFVLIMTTLNDSSEAYAREGRNPSDAPANRSHEPIPTTDYDIRDDEGFDIMRIVDDNDAIPQSVPRHKAPRHRKVQEYIEGENVRRSKRQRRRSSILTGFE